MSKKRYTDEFKEEAVRLIRDRKYSVKEVSERLGVTTNSLYNWLGGVRSHKHEESLSDLEKEVRKLRSELKRVEEERDILKKAAAYFAKESH